MIDAKKPHTANLKLDHLDAWPLDIGKKKAEPTGSALSKA